MFKVESNVPMPPRQNHRNPKYPLKEMKVGDSFLIPGKAEKQGAISGYMTARQRELGMKFATRKEGNDLRVWRTE